MLLDIDYNPQQGNVACDDAYRHLLPPSPLNHWVQSFWQLNVPTGKFSYHSVPDNCVDWIINLDCFEDNFIVSPFLSSIQFDLTGPVSYFGIRFRLLGHQGLVSTPLGEWSLASDVTMAVDLLPSDVLNAAFESLQETSIFNEHCKYLSVLLLSAVKRVGIDPRVARYVRYCHNNIRSCIKLSDRQCSEFGVSARQLRRLTQLHLGLRPTDFAIVLRFQRTLKATHIDTNKSAWADHYYDQSHYIREFKRLSGFTPTEFRNLSVLSNQQSKS